MEEDIKEIEIIITTLEGILQKNIKDTDENVYSIDGRQFRAIKNLLKTHQELQDEFFWQQVRIRNEYIPKSKIEEQIKWLDNDIKNTKHKLEEGKRPYPNYIGEYRRLRMKAFNTKSREIKERLQKLLEEE